MKLLGNRSRNLFLANSDNCVERESPRTISLATQLSTLRRILSRGRVSRVLHSRVFASEIRFRNLGSGSYFLFFFFFAFSYRNNRYKDTITCDLPIYLFILFFFFFYVKNLHREIDDYINIARKIIM